MMNEENPAVTLRLRASAVKNPHPAPTLTHTINLPAGRQAING